MRLVLDSPLDMHLHLRDGDMLKITAPLSAESFSGALIMPNLVPPVDSKEKVLAYKNRILDSIGNSVFEPYMTLFFKNYSEKELAEVKDEILAIKLYPAGVTTNSEAGISSLKEGEKTFKIMEEMGIPLSVHGETHGFVMDREKEFMAIYSWLAETFPKLKIIMEHISTKDAVENLDRYENIFATVTLHHLLITLDDVAGGLLKPHLFCKPIAKRGEDRDALLKIALDSHPKLMFGSDSAPHPKDKKEACGCAAGVFTAPFALQYLAELFEKHNKLANLQSFISDNAKRIYNIKPLKKRVVLEKRDFKIPDNYEKVVPMENGKILKWSII